MVKLSTFVDPSREMDESAWWDFWNKSYRAEDNRDATSTELFAHVVNVLAAISPQPARILEVACGTGTLSRQLSFSSYHGLDISPAAIEIAQLKAGDVAIRSIAERPTYEAADFHDWALPPEPFDIGLCVDAISCFRDQAFVLKKMAQSVRSGGRVVLTSVNPFVYNRIRRVGGVKLQNGPVSHWLSGRELHSLIMQAGLFLESSYTIMPRGNMGILRVLNARRLNLLLGQQGSELFRGWKERVGLGQYRVVVARKG